MTVVFLTGVLIGLFLGYIAHVLGKSSKKQTLVIVPKNKIGKSVHIFEVEE